MRAQVKALRTAGQYQKAKQMKQCADAREGLEMDAAHVKWDQGRNNAMRAFEKTRKPGELLEREVGQTVERDRAELRGRPAQMGSENADQRKKKMQSRR
jgi:hypothetical protein